MRFWLMDMKTSGLLTAKFRGGASRKKLHLGTSDFKLSVTGFHDFVQQASKQWPLEMSGKRVSSLGLETHP